MKRKSKGDSLQQSKRASTQESPKNKRKRKKPVRVKMGVAANSIVMSVTKKLLRDIKLLQMRTDNIIPKAPFSRLVREIMMEFCPNDSQFKIQYEALRALHESAEFFLTEMFEKANQCAMHAKRVTLMPKDMRLVFCIRNEGDYME